MARLLDWPIGLGKVSYQRLSGPRSVGSSSSESMTGFVQTVASAFGVWRYQLSLQTMHKRKHRLYRGMVTALHGGANAVRVPFNDPDVISFKEAGITSVPEGQTNPTAPFSNGKPFSNGCKWAVSRPAVKLSADAAKGATIITLADQYWGHELIGGEWLGFFPFHFSKYEVTQVLDDGQYRIWPPLRAALTAVDEDGNGSFAKLDNIVMAMRLEGEGGGTVQRGVSVSEGNTMTLIEVTDDIVRDEFAD
jgi:hypothetical protein